MGRLEVQGIVSVRDNMPRVQFRQLDSESKIEAEWQSEVIEAREMAQQILEATMNAVYDAAIIGWANETWPDDPRMGAEMLVMIRKYRVDHWGLPDQPEDWRPE